MQFELTPKALANLSPWLDRSDNHGGITSKPESVRRLADPIRVGPKFSSVNPGFSLARTLG